jgi:hypothetical protein
MVEKWFAIMWVSILIFDLGINLGKHGEVKKESKYNFWSALIAFCIAIVVAWLGGLFRCFE